jgi:hypothetical protein
VIRRIGTAILATAIAEEGPEGKPHVPHEDFPDEQPPPAAVAAGSSAHVLTFVNDEGQPLTFVNNSGWPVYFTGDRSLLESTIRYAGESYKIIS